MPSLVQVAVATTHGRRVLAKPGRASQVDDRPERRASPRTPFGHPAVLQFEDQSTQVTICDLTREGCRIETEVELGANMVVSIGIPGIGHTSGRIIWKSDREFGCAFDRSLQPGAITAAFSHNPTSSRMWKLGARARISIFVGAVTTSWVLVGGCVLGIIYSGKLT